MLVPKITSYNTKDIPAMYKQWYVLVAIYEDKMFWHRNEQVVVDEDNAEKQAMYEKMRELKTDPVRYKELEQEAFNLLTPTQQKSEAMRFHRDSKIREIIMGMVG